MLVTIHTNESFAKLWLNAHEFGNSDNLRDWTTEQGSTRYQQTNMDLKNNNTGIYNGKTFHKKFFQSIEDGVVEAVNWRIQN